MPVRSLLTVIFALLLWSPLAEAASDHSHDHDHDHDHDHGMAVEVVDDGNAPSLRLEAVLAPDGPARLVLHTRNFRFAEDKVDQAHAPGEGHAHLYLNGEKIGRVYGETHELGDLPPGTHELRATLNSNDHQAYEVAGQAVASELTVEIPARAANRVFALRIAGGKLAGGNTIRVTQGDRVELQWTGDEAASLHLHGYDIETALEPGVAAVMAFTAEVAGRFPVETHALGGHDHEATLLYLEVHPD